MTIIKDPVNCLSVRYGDLILNITLIMAVFVFVKRWDMWHHDDVLAEHHLGPSNVFRMDGISD